MKTLTLVGPAIRFSQVELSEAYGVWGCNCGPAALAAVLDLSLTECFCFLGRFDKRRYMNTQHMQEAIEQAGRRWRNVKLSPDTPTLGLTRVQWHGSWLLPGVPLGAAAKRTHWIGLRHHEGQRLIYDVNASFGFPKTWETADEWENGTAPQSAEWIRGCDGTWSITNTLEILAETAR